VSEKYLETIKSVDGVVFHLKYHQQRLEDVLSNFKTSKTYNLKELLNPPKNGLYRCRVLYDIDSIEIEYISYSKRSIKSLKLVYDDTIEYSKKYKNRDDINRLFLLKENCDDILIVKNGLITDTSIANIALFDGTKWFTPTLPLLKGTIRQRLLSQGEIYEKEISVSDIKNYTKLALMNAMIDFDIIAEENIRDIIC